MEVWNVLDVIVRRWLVQALKVPGRGLYLFPPSSKYVENVYLLWIAHQVVDDVSEVQTVVVLCWHVPLF